MSVEAPLASPGALEAATARASANALAAPLTELAVGTSGCVQAVNGERGLRYRLLELGLLPGTELAVLRCAPGGDPIEIGLRGYALSLRRDEAATVLVVPSTASTHGA